MSLLGLDTGGSGCKATLFSKDGKKINQSYMEYSSISKNQYEIEFPIHEMWEKIKKVILKSAEFSKIFHDPVEALCFSTVSDAIVLLDKNYNLLHNSFADIDRRGEEFLSDVSTDLDSLEIYYKTGNILDFFFLPLRLLWLKKYKNEIYRKIYKIYQWQEYFLFKLGVEPITDPSLASRLLIFDIKNKCWIKKYLDYFNINIDFPSCCR